MSKQKKEQAQQVASSVTVQQLREAVACEALAFEDLLQTLERESDALDSRRTVSDSEERRSIVRRLGGQALIECEERIAEAEAEYDAIQTAIAEHNGELASLPLLRLMWRYRRVRRRGRRLERRRRHADEQQKQAKKTLEALIRSLATPDNITRALQLSRDIRYRHREQENRKKQLRVRRRLLLENLHLCREIDGLLSQLADTTRLPVHGHDLQELISDANFQSLLRASR